MQDIAYTRNKSKPQLETATQSSAESESRTEPIWVSRFFNILRGQKPSKNPTGESLSTIAPLINELKRIFQDEKVCRCLMGCQASDAQRLLDSFQQLLDRTDLDLPFRKDLIIATQRLSAKTGLFPTCYKLKNVTRIGKDPVASGGVADIYKGEFRGQAVGLKTVRLNKKSQVDHMLKKFWKEAMLWGQLSDPNVLSIYGLYLDKNRVSIVSPWMENEDLRGYLDKNSSAPRARLASDVASGLMYLHNNAIIHGDLKSPNVLIDNSGRARLADFGISSVLDASIAVWTSQPRDVSKGGTLRWRAPEVLQAKATNSKESDVYAWGCVAWEIFTGQIPFPEFENDVAVAHHIITVAACQMRPDPSNQAWKDSGLTEEIWACMTQCWDREPLKRPSVTTIVQHLNATFNTPDPRQDQVADKFSPPEFRREMNGGLRTLTAKELKKIVSQGPEATRAERRNKSRVGGGNWKKEIKRDDTFIEDGMRGDLIIPVMGPAGSGKSTFINTLLGKEAARVGHALQSETEHIHFYLLPGGGRRVFMVDTPAFADTSTDDREILRRIAVWMAKSYSDDMKVAGIIYLHEITQPRMTWVMRKNLNMFEKLCGPNAASSIILATTKWDEISPRNVGERREAQLRDEHWKDMLKEGSQLRRFEGTQISAQTIVEGILARTALIDALQVQLELVKVNKLLAETEAGRTLRCTLKKLLAELYIVSQLEQQAGNDSKVCTREIVAARNHRVRLLNQQIDDLKIPFSRRILYTLRLL
ncbi:hypothetical protein DXG01_005357 [Tephrocybe rancida]|nr:hypothetical protein DXG01_005357 [Tephrocybe rancida]